MMLALPGLGLSGGVRAQTPDARPQGGQVVAGQASISQTAGRTQIDQSSRRAVVEWQRFNVGAQHQVDIRQPDAGAWSLQRVTGGDPSAIAGRITSNGGVALVNPAGITFAQGAQVDVAALIATPSDISNPNFMAGRMAFDGTPRPGARVENRGTITVREQGLAALVGPVVANSGTIRARLGRVALAGGVEAFGLDLAGDGLLALDVTRQVTAAPGGATALTTQAGRIEAEGGQVLITAAAASGLLETLVLAGGEVAAPGGRVAIEASGGGARIEGRIDAASIAATASGEVLVASGAVLEAGGAGGRVVVGGGAESRIGAPQRLAGRSTVERGARVAADGPGGTVILHSTTRTAHHGTASASGAGGAVEVSSRGALAIDGAMLGESVLIDPVTLRVVSSLTGAAEPAEVTAASINATTGALTLQADSTIIVEAAITKPLGPLTLQTTNTSATATQGIRLLRRVNVTGDLTLLSAGDILQDASGATLTAGTLFALSSAGQVRLDAGGNAVRALAGGGAATRFDLATTTTLGVDGLVRAPALRLSPSQRLTLRAPLEVSGTLTLEALRGVVQAASGAGISAGTLVLEAPLGRVALTGAGNRIAALGDAQVPAGLTLQNDVALNIAGTVTGGQVTLTVAAGDLTQDPAASRVTSPDLGLFAPAGSVRLDGALNVIQALNGRARDSFVVDAGGALLLSAPVSGATVDLRAAGEIAQDLGALVTAGLLRVNAIGGALTLDDPLNAIAALGDSGAGGAFALATAGSLALRGVLAAPSVSLTAGGAITQDATSAVTTARLDLAARGGDALLLAPGNAVSALGGGSATRDFGLATTAGLLTQGALEAGRDLTLSATTLDLGAPITAGGTLRLTAGFGDVAQQTAGRLSAAALQAEAPVGSVRLEAGNALRGIAGSAGFEFRVATGGSPALGSIAAPQVALTVSGDLLQTVGGAPISADRLEVFAGGRVDLAAGNLVPSLGSMVAPGGLGFTTGTALQLTAPIDVPSARFTVLGDLTQLSGAGLSAGSLTATSLTGSVRLAEGANQLPLLAGVTAAGDIRLVGFGAMEIAGPLRAAGLVALQANDSLSQAPSGAGITASLLEARSMGGEVALTGAGNAVLRLGRGGAQGGFAFTHGGAGPVTLEGLIAAPGLDLVLPRGLSQASGGALRTPFLRLDAAGPVTLGGPGHAITALGGRAAALTLASEAALELVEALGVAGALSLSAPRLALSAPVQAGSATLRATLGNITQDGGGVLSVAGPLVLEALGSVDLPLAGNSVARLSGGQAGGGFALRSGTAMTVQGEVRGESILLGSLGELLLDGAMLAADRAVLLAVPGGLAAGAQSRMLARDPSRLPVLIVDARQIGGLASVPFSVQADLPGLAAAQQPTQLASFGAAKASPGAPVVIDILAGGGPLFLLLDSGPVLGALDAGRLGVLGAGGSAFLLGSVGGVAGSAAAALVEVSGPAGSTGYALNNCPMGAANCGRGPDTDRPDTGRPDTDRPDVDKPIVEKPDIDRPIVEVPVLPPVLVAGSELPAELAGSFAAIAPPVMSWADLRAASRDLPGAWQENAAEAPLLPLFRREEEVE
jgi:filamentous hemagglutinin family protein